MITPADSAPQAPAQLPAAAGPGPAAVPHPGMGPASYGIQAVSADVSQARMPGDGVLAGTPGHEPEAPLAAPNVNPYEAGAPQAIYAGGDRDPAGTDDVAASVAASVAAAQARAGTHQRDTYGQGSSIGDLMALPAQTSDGSDGGAFYDPPRDYGD
jgi:hypothetical protein